MQKYVGENKNYTNFEEYYNALSSGGDQELITNFVNILTTNYSFFFREKIHFEFLKHFLKNKIENYDAIGFWSAACSSGEEPYSIAMTCLENLTDINDINLKILATDISTKVLGMTNKGSYDLSKVEKSLTKMQLINYFIKDAGNNLITANEKIDCF